MRFERKKKTISGIEINHHVIPNQTKKMLSRHNDKEKTKKPS